MKVLDIQCSLGHIFEGWFASEDDFQKQRSRSLIECPFCGDTKVQKRLSAPRLKAKSNQKRSGEIATPASNQLAAAAQMSSDEVPSDKMQQIWSQVVEQVVKNTEDVGEDFAQEAKRIHYGEAQKRGIRGQATVEQALELEEEGIDVVPLGVVPAGHKGTVQ